MDGKKNVFWHKLMENEEDSNDMTRCKRSPVSIRSGVQGGDVSQFEKHACVSQRKGYPG